MKKAIELKKQLDALQENCLYNVYSSDVDWNKKVDSNEVKQFVDKKIEAERPHLKEPISAEKRRIETKYIVTYSVCIILGLVGIIAPLCLMNTFNAWYYWICVGAFLLLVGVIGFAKEAYTVNKGNSNLEQEKILSKEIEKYNLEEYPKLLSMFEAKKARLEKDYLKKVSAAHKKVYEIRNQIEELDILSFKYLPYAQDILDYIIDRRADTIKEAVNLLVEEFKDQGKKIEPVSKVVANVGEKSTESEVEDDGKVKNGDKNEPFIKKSAKWYTYFTMFYSNQRKVTATTTQFKQTASGLQMESRDNSRKASLTRYCGQCLSVSGEEPMDLIFGFFPMKKKFCCCSANKGFMFTGDDILSYRVISSNSQSEKYELLHKCGKKIIVSVTPVGAELLNAVIGGDKLVS